MTAEGAEPRPPAAVPSGGIGPTLRAARERRGLSVAAITETLHVDSKVIEAMEAGRFTVFDAPVYARGFIRKYAGFLELPADELIAAYDALAGGPATPTLIPLATATAPSRDLSRLKLPAIFVLALAFVCTSLWWWMSRPAPPPPAAAATTPAASIAAPTAPPPAAELAAADVPPVQAPAAEAGRVPAPERAASRPAEPRRAASASMLNVKGLRECWVEVYSPSGARLFYDLVQPGDSHALPGPGPWKVFLGNADGVRLSLDERAIEVPAGVRAGATARFVVLASGAVR